MSQISNSIPLNVEVVFSKDGELNEKGKISSLEKMALSDALDQANKLALQWYNKYNKNKENEWKDTKENLLESYLVIFNLYIIAMQTLSKYLANQKKEVLLDKSAQAISDNIATLQKNWFYYKVDNKPPYNKQNLIRLADTMRRPYLLKKDAPIDKS